MVKPTAGDGNRVLNGRCSDALEGSIPSPSVFLLLRLVPGGPLVSKSGGQGSIPWRPLACLACFAENSNANIGANNRTNAAACTKIRFVFTEEGGMVAFGVVGIGVEAYHVLRAEGHAEFAALTAFFIDIDCAMYH